MKDKRLFHERDIVTDFFENFSFKLFKYVARRTLIFILLFSIIAFLVPFLYIRYSVPVYSTAASLLKKKDADNSFILEDANKLIKNEGEEKLNRDIQILKSEALLKNLVDSFKLDIEYYKLGRISKNKMELYGNKTPILVDKTQLCIKNPDIYKSDIIVEVHKTKYDLSYKINGVTVEKNQLKSGQLFENKDILLPLFINDIGTEGRFLIRFNDEKEIISFIQNNISINHDNNNIYLTTKSTNPQKSEFVLNKLINNFLEYDKRENGEKIENSLKYIQDQLDTFNREYDESQRSKSDFVRETNLYDPSSQISTSLSSLVEYEKKIDELKFVVTNLESIKKNLSKNNFTSPNSFSYSDILLEIGNSSNIQTLIASRNKMLLDYTPEHPLVKAVNKQLEEKLTMMSYETRNKIKENELMIQSLRDKINTAKGSLNKSTSLSSEYSKMDKQSLLKEKFITELLEKKNQFQVLKSSIVSDYIVLDSPKSNATAITPKVNLSYILSFIFFIILSVGLILYRYITFDKIVSLDALKRETDVPVLGIVPFVENAVDLNEKKTSSPRSKIVVLEQSKSRVSEAFKKIRANMKYLDSDHYKVVATTSTVSGEGKTFVLMNLAMVHALLDKKVIILDFDLRKPRIAKSFNLDNSYGVSTILSNNASFRDCIQNIDGLNNLDIITSGPVPPNPSELVLSARFSQLLEELKSNYDYVFIDTPPLGLVNESIEIINKVDIPIYIVRSNYSKREFIDNINEVYHNKQNKNLYIIFNHFGDGASGYVNYGYGYGNNYGNTYNDEFSKKHEGYYSEKNINKNKNWLKAIFSWKL